MRNRDLNLRHWSWVDEKGKYFHKLEKGRYYKGYFDYNLIKTELEKIIPYTVTDSSTIIIEYYFKDDLCSDPHKDNKWTSSEISERKSFLNPIKKDLRNRGIFFISLFEKGIKLRNRPTSKNEYFFVDENNFFKENLFKSPTTCGSHAAIKTNNQTLVQNGENRADYFAENLSKENWSLFFSSATKE
ncbi:hypothetical protein [Winogradskyella aurantia]|nr:hypothetical protein [Winogradskyella aurantia]